MLLQNNMPIDYIVDSKQLEKERKYLQCQDYDVVYIFSNKQELEKFFLQKVQLADNYIITDEDELKHFIPMPKIEDVIGQRAYEIIFQHYNGETEMFEEKDFRILKEDFIYKAEFNGLKETILKSFTIK